MKSLRIVAFVLCVSAAGFASDHEFSGVVNAIEDHYGVRHTHIPLLGFAMFFARPEGVSGMKLAVFEDFHTRTDAAESAAAVRHQHIRHIVEHSLGDGWYPFVRVNSRVDGETTLIYARPNDADFRMMIVNVESNEATIIEFKLSARAIKRWMREPGEQAEGQSHRHHHDD